MQILALLIAISIVNLNGCKARFSATKGVVSNDIMASKATPGSPSLEGRKPVVLIYKNDTVSSIANGSLLALRRALSFGESNQAMYSADQRAFFSNLLNQINTEYDAFSLGYVLEISINGFLLCDKDAMKANRIGGFMQISNLDINEIEHEGKPGLICSSSDDLETIQKKYVLNPEYPIKDYPLMDTVNLNIFLENAVKNFDPTSHKFILIVKSHGDSGKVLAPKLKTNFSVLSNEEILAGISSLIKSKANSPTKDGLNTTSEIDKIFVDRQGLGLQGISKIVEPTADDILQTIKEHADKNDMMFPIVFFESCDSLNLNQPNLVSQLNTNKFSSERIGRVFGSDKNGISYQTLDYYQIMIDYLNKKSSLEVLYEKALENAKEEGTSFSKNYLEIRNEFSKINTSEWEDTKPHYWAQFVVERICRDVSDTMCQEFQRAYKKLGD